MWPPKKLRGGKKGFRGAMQHAKGIKGGRGKCGEPLDRDGGRLLLSFLTPPRGKPNEARQANIESGKKKGGGARRVKHHGRLEVAEKGLCNQPTSEIKSGGEGPNPGRGAFKNHH